MKNFSIKNKLSLLTVSVIIVAGFFISIGVFVYLKGILSNERINKFRQYSLGKKNELAEVIKRQQIFVKMLGTRTRVVEYLEIGSEERREELQHIFDTYNEDDRSYLSIYLMDDKGNVLISTDRTFIGNNYSFRDYFKKPLGGIPYVEALLGKTSNQFGYYFSHPVLNKEGKTIGVVVAKLDEASISKPVLERDSNGDENVMLVNEYGVIIYSDRPERFLKSLGSLSEEEKKEILEKDIFLKKEIPSLKYDEVQSHIRNYTTSKSFEFYDPEDGKKEFIDISSIDGTPFYLVFEVNLNKISRSIFPIIILVVFGVFISSLLVALVVYFSLKIFLSPLEKIKILSNKLSKGDFSQRIEIKSKDEMGELASVFNLMAERLKYFYGELKQKVEEKTLEIEKRKTELEEQQIAILNILEDIEEEKNKIKETQAKDEALLEGIGEGVIATDIEGRIIFINKKAEEMLGWRAVEIMGKILQETLEMQFENGSKIPINERPIELALKLGKKTFTSSRESVYYVRKDKSRFPASVSVTPVVLSGKTIGAIDVFRDSTKEKEVDRAKTEFVSLASHQLRTPLSAINWYAEMLLAGDAGKLSKDQDDYVREIYKSNQRMVELVGALLNVSRIDLGTLSVDVEPTDFKEIAESVIEELAPSIRKKKIKIFKKFAENIPTIKSDPKLTRMVFQNLISNSVKYTLESGRIDVEMEKDGKNILIKISDNGLGIPKNQQDKIFGKLFRADNVRLTDTEGTGLGLYLVKSIVDFSKGKIWFESEENKGTKFYVSLPLSGMKNKKGTKKLS